MRIPALIAATVAALALAAPASAASPALHDPGLNADSYVMDQDLGNDRGHIGRHDIGASASVQLIDTAALGAAGHRGHVLLN